MGNMIQLYSRQSSHVLYPLENMENIIQFRMVNKLYIVLSSRLRITIVIILMRLINTTNVQMLLYCLTKCCFTFIHTLEIPAQIVTILVIIWTFIPMLNSVILLLCELSINKTAIPNLTMCVCMCVCVEGGGFRTLSWVLKLCLHFSEW